MVTLNTVFTEINDEFAKSKKQLHIIFNAIKHSPKNVIFHFASFIKFVKKFYDLKSKFAVNILNFDLSSEDIFLLKFILSDKNIRIIQRILLKRNLILFEFSEKRYKVFWHKYEVADVKITDIIKVQEKFKIKYYFLNKIKKIKADYKHFIKKLLQM